MVIAVAVLGVATPMRTAEAQDAWNPFASRDETRRPPRDTGSGRPPPLPPMEGRTWWSPAASTDAPPPSASGADANGYSPPPWAERRATEVERWPSDARGEANGRPASSTVERETLPPLPGEPAAVDRARPPLGSDAPYKPAYASPESGPPSDMWGSLTAAEVESLLASVPMPPRSPALTALWRRLWLQGDGPRGDNGQQAHALALRLEVLYRSGLLTELQEAIQTIPAELKKQPLIGYLIAKTQVGIGLHAEGCQTLKASAGGDPPPPPKLKPEMTLLAGYCAAASGNKAGVELAASIAREQGVDPASIPLQVFDQMARGGRPPALPKHVSLIDFRFLDVAAGIEQRQAIEHGDAAVLTLFALGSQDPALRVAAAEQGARLSIVPPASLADAYRAASARSGDHGLRRAAAFNAVMSGNGGQELTRLLGDARQAGLLRPIALALGDKLDAVHAGSERSAFSDTLIEALIAAGRLDAARALAGTDGRGASARTAHWAVLMDIADIRQRAPRAAGLDAMQQIALARRAKPEFLHRLVTVLNALEMQVPLPLWEAASATPQPTDGYLPETGVLTDLKVASAAREPARTILLTIKAVGPEGGEGANLLALDDAIRALKRAGFETEARMLATEALLGAWPRQSG